MTYDAIIIGGGLGGSALADQLARASHNVLVLERETQFRDRVRGENMLCWGVAAAKRLGIYNELVAAGGRESPYWVTYAMGEPSPTRDLRATTPGGDAMLNIYHPRMQEALLARTVASGAAVKRGATVISVDAAPGRSPEVTYESEGVRVTESARIVVGADGRASQVRSWAGFDVRRDQDLLTIAGMLVEGSGVPDDTTFLCMGPGIACFWAPQGDGRARAYFIYPGVAGRRKLSGSAKVDEFLECVRSVGIPSAWTHGVESNGPLAEFDGACTWVESPAKNGVVLIGDAAAATDPSWGSGLALTVTDVEHLSNALRSTQNWDAAIARYAEEHDRYFTGLHNIHTWMTELLWTPGPEADERRGRVMPRWEQNPMEYPDLAGLGPFGPCDDRARQLVLGLA